MLQIAVVLAVCALALTVCVALISTAELKRAGPVALYGLGSGEEQDADNSIVTTFEVRDSSFLYNSLPLSTESGLVTV